ncbi:hypothetical protein [Brevundimonas sp. 1080]|uniref:hypothetical protein n=1 Tax=Brevundimonas sp. 1080 TaxID=3156405 RepID=UPI003391B4D6
MVDVVAGGFDFDVRSADRVPVDMIDVPLGRARRNVVVGSPTYLEAHETPMVPEELLNHACLRVRLPNGAIYRWPFEKDGQSVISTSKAALSSTKPASQVPPPSRGKPTCAKTSRRAGWSACWKTGPPTCRP